MVQTRRRRAKAATGGTPAVAPVVAKKSSGGGGGEPGSRKRKRVEKSTGGDAELPSVAPCNDDVATVKTAKGCAGRWAALLALRDGRRALADTSLTAERKDCNLDPFDCTDLIIPSAHELVNREVAAGVGRWSDLAARVIVEEGDSAVEADGEGGDRTPLRNHELLIDAAPRGDRRQQRLLPQGFDYACKRSENTATDGEGNHRPKVVSLLDPTQTLDYGEELGHVFRAVRTAEELEKMYALGGTKKNEDGIDGADDGEVVSHGCQHTVAIKNNLPEWLAKYNRMDAHSLGRLRVRKRNSYPVGGAIAAIASGESAEGGAGQSAAALQTTVRFEILRHSHNLKRGSGVDSNRMEVELHGSHTLLDLHLLLVECSLSTASNGGGSNGQEDGICAGVFFIEDTFYTCGELGTKAGDAIRGWLDGKEPESVESSSLAKDKATMTPRRQFLGLQPRNEIVPMSQMKLEDLPLRLGVRYFHMIVPPQTPLELRPDNNLWSLANESVVYVTGINTHKITGWGGNGNDGKPPIIIHDTWGPQPRHVCSACNFSLASVVVVGGPLSDGAPPGLDEASNRVHLEGVPMCSSCYRALQYRPSNEQGEGGKPVMEIRPGTQPGLVFTIEEYQRMATASALDEVAKGTSF